MWGDDEADVFCQALPRPTAYISERLFADLLSPTLAFAARLNQRAAAGWSGAATPCPESRACPRQCIALGNPASAPIVNHPTACSNSCLVT